MFRELLRERLAGIVDLSDSQAEQLEHHYELLVRWNRVLNLTSIDRIEEVVERHYGESLFLALHLSSGSIADIGSGAGFPGMPVAVLRPDCQVTLIESRQRKAVFLKESTRGLANVRVLARRADDVDERFDWAVSRAVNLKELARPLKQLAPRVALLTGADPPPPCLPFRWAPPIPLPWGRQRFLLRGQTAETCFT